METLLNRKQVAEILGVSIMTVKRREASGLLNPVRLESRIIRFRLSDIDACITENTLRRQRA